MICEVFPREIYGIFNETLGTFHDIQNNREYLLKLSLIHAFELTILCEAYFGLFFATKWHHTCPITIQNVL